ncbi:MAG: protein kinase, partial [Deltaproteobacteria bacterium]|nr:protein kinase [Deltaproteobacteria bacterium]
MESVPGPADPAEGLASGTQVGNYRIEERAGSGSFAVVYRATHTALGRPVALKIMRGSRATDPALVRRFQREAQIVSRIKHPNLIDIYDFGTLEDGRPYFAMEWIDGVPLAAELERRRIRPDEALAIAREIAAGLQRLHSQHIVHRDLHADNVMLLGEGSEVRIKLLDLGFAKVLDADEQLSMPGSQLGSPAAMSPEQIEGADVTPASDVYSFGVLIFHLLTGRLPFKANKPQRLLAMHRSAPRPKLSEWIDVPPLLDSVVEKAMAVDHSARYQSVADLLVALERAVRATSQSGPELAAGTVLAGSYRITGTLGKGGMGLVYAAEHTRLPQQFAVKVMTEAHDDAALARFRREAEIASGIGHSNIVRVFDFNELPDGTPYLVMEFLRGHDLADILKSEGALPLDRTLAIARQVGSALAAAHASGVVHRDLKPSNIFLTRREVAGRIMEHVTVLDFGVSKMQGSTTISTETNALVGTPMYMAPEQAMGDNHEVASRADQFALAAVIFEMLTGQMAFDGKGLAQIVYKVCNHDPPRLDRVVPAVPATVADAVQRALAKLASHRFPDMAGFVEALTGAPLELLDRVPLRTPTPVPTAGASRPVAAPSTVPGKQPLLPTGPATAATAPGRPQPSGPVAAATVPARPQPSGPITASTAPGYVRPPQPPRGPPAISQSMSAHAGPVHP